jgi:hypothetical protein
MGGGVPPAPPTTPTPHTPQHMDPNYTPDPRDWFTLFVPLWATVALFLGFLTCKALTMAFAN